jgi:hypothetical protein
MSFMTRLAALTGVAILASQYSSPIHRARAERDPMCSGRKIIPAGAQRFTFDDGFECIAINQASANRKHEKHLKK